MNGKKRKYGSVILLALCLSLLLPSFAFCRELTASDAPEGQDSAGGSVPLAEAVVLMDMDTGDMLYSKDMGVTQYPGDLTKIMTVLLLAENCNLEEKVAFSEILYDVGDDGLRLGIQPGEEITLYDAACAAVLGSANDVSNGIAEYVAGSPAAFAERMNERAAELGCANTHFSNPHGLYSEDQYTCAYDLALIGRAAYENETVSGILGMKEYTIPATNLTGDSRLLLNNHQMLQEDSTYYRDWCVGGKESYTSQNLNTILTFASSEGRNLVSVVMGVADANEAYAKTVQLLSFGLEEGSASMEKTTENSAERVPEPAETPEAAGGVQRLPQAGTESVETPETAGGVQRLPQAGTESVETPETAGGVQRLPQAGTESVETSETAGGVQRLPQAGTESVEQQAAESKVDFVIDMLETHWNELRNFLYACGEDHFEEVFAAGCMFMVSLLVLIILLLKRRITNSRIRRKRKRAEQIRHERESQLESMSIEELEEELRRRMEQDGK